MNKNPVAIIAPIEYRRRIARATRRRRRNFAQPAENYGLIIRNYKMTDRYNGANRLRRLHGMRGYGIYCRIVELCASAPGKKLRYDLDDLVYDMREKRELVKEIV